MGNLSAGRAPTPRGGHSSEDLLFLLHPAGHRAEFSFLFCFSPFIFLSFPKSSYYLWSQCIPAATDPVNKSLHRSNCLNISHTTTPGEAAGSGVPASGRAPTAKWCSSSLGTWCPPAPDTPVLGSCRGRLQVWRRAGQPGDEVHVIPGGLREEVHPGTALLQHPRCTKSRSIRKAESCEQRNCLCSCFFLHRTLSSNT